MMLKKNIFAFVGALLCVVLVMLGIISTKHRIVPITNGMDLINELKKKNYTVEITNLDYDADKSMFLVKPIRITANGNMLAIYEYSSHTELENFARTVSSDGYQIGLSFVSWISKPHFFKSGNIIVEYIGENSSIIEDIKSIMGKPFAYSK